MQSKKMMHSLFLSICGALVTAVSGCTMPTGPWHYHDEQYTITMDKAGSTTGPLTAKVVPGHAGACTWCVAHGVLNPDGTMEMHYDNGDSNTGTLSKDCNRFSWGWEAGTGQAEPLFPEAASKPCVPGHHQHPSPSPGPPIKPNEPNNDVKVVHVINSCHLDIGFADSSQGIINRYFDHHFPLAAAEGKQFRSGKLKGPHPKNLNFMFQSWVVSMYLDCPTGMGLHCPTAAQVADFEVSTALLFCFKWRVSGSELLT